MFKKWLNAILMKHVRYIPICMQFHWTIKQFRLNKINEIKNHFVAQMKERELMSKSLSKYVASFDYFDKSLIVLSVTTGYISIGSFATVIGAPVGIVSASFSLAFSILTGFVKTEVKAW